MPSHDIAVRLPLATPGLRIGLLGGSFNPAHEAHRLISETALKRLGLDQIWWIVSPGNPLKDHAALQPLVIRMTEARRVAVSPRIRLTGFEAQRQSRYTVDTLTFLVRRLPGVQFVWVMGADNLVQMPRWRAWRRIFTLMPVAVVNRPGWHLTANASRASRTFERARVREAAASAIFEKPLPCWVMLRGPLSHQSSTALRAARPAATMKSV